MSSLSKLQKQLRSSPYAEQNKYLGMPDFGVMMGIAAALHLAAVLVWMAMPKNVVDTIPVRVLNVRLGVDGGTLAADAPTTGSAQAGGDQIRLGNASMGSRVTEVAEETPQQTTDQRRKVTQALDNALIQDKSRVPEQEAVNTPTKYVRPNAQRGWGDRAAPQVANGNEAMARYGSPLGNSTDANAESLNRYSQVVSLWINKHKTYPQMAYERGMQGEGKVYIESDRKGRILRYYISESTGSSLLDAAMRTAVSNSNPLPAVPAGYATPDILRHVVALKFYRGHQ